MIGCRMADENRRPGLLGSDAGSHIARGGGVVRPEPRLHRVSGAERPDQYRSLIPGKSP